MGFVIKYNNIETAEQLSCMLALFGGANFPLPKRLQTNLNIVFIVYLHCEKMITVVYNDLRLLV